MTAPDHVLAVDLGTGGPKAALVTLDGEIVAHEFEPTEVLLLDGGGAEQDPDSWWTAITAAVRRVLGQGVVPVERIAAVSVTAQWSGTVPVDTDCRHLHNAVIWMDSRGARQVKSVVRGPVNVLGYDPRKLRTWISRTGGAPSHSGKDSLAHILWLQAARPDVARATATYLEPCDYLNARICGRRVSSYDAIVAHWLTDNRDIDRVDYSPELLDNCGIDRGQLPDLVPSATVVGTVLPAVGTEWGLAEGTKVVTATGDVHSAVLGSGALADYAGHLYIGTSSWLSCHVPSKRTDLLHNQAALPSALPGRYFLANEHEAAGSCLLHLRDNLGLVADLDEANAVAAAAPVGSHRLIYTPWLNGERTPVDDHTIRGGWNNLTLAHDRSDMVRSVFEGVAYNNRWLLEVVEKFVKRRFDGLNFIGGGAKSDLWCQIHADVFDRPIRQMAEPQHANARGAAFVASIALGHGTVDQLGRQVGVTAEFRPNAHSRATYDELYAEFVNLYKAHKPIHRRLNRH